MCASNAQDADAVFASPDRSLDSVLSEAIRDAPMQAPAFVFSDHHDKTEINSGAFFVQTGSEFARRFFFDIQFKYSHLVKKQVCTVNFISTHDCNRPLFVSFCLVKGMPV